MNIIRRAAVYILLTIIYGFTWLIAIFGSIIPRRSWKPTDRIMVTGTFHNPNWYLSHIVPLVRSGIKEVILVIDEPQLPLEGVRFVCWPSWVSKLLSRQGARAIWMFLAGFRYRPDLYMGYHLGPGACTALIVGKLMGRPVCCQMTCGQVEFVGGGYEDIEGVGKHLGHPSKLIEKMALAVINLFDLVVVRGSKTKRCLVANNIKEKIAIITGSVQRHSNFQQANRRIHLIFVGRLSPTKQIDQFIRIVKAVSCFVPSIKAAIVGNGTLMKNLLKLTGELRLQNNIEFLGKRKDVEKFLECSKIFVLTSKTEGLSIAMAEAMALGVVPVVANVGELSDLVINGVNGYLIEPNNIDEFSQRILQLIQNQTLWEECSQKAIESAINHCGIEVISKKWQEHIHDIVSQASGYIFQEVIN